MTGWGPVAKLCLGVALVALSLGVAVQASTAREQTEPMAATTWLLPPQPAAGREWRGIKIMIQTGYCLGDPKPVLDHVKVIEAPAANPDRFKATITAYVRRPAPVEPPGRAGATEEVDVCNGLGLGIPHWVKLKHPAGQFAFFDGSDSPPRRVPLVFRH